MTYLFLFIRRSMFIFLFSLSICLMVQDSFATQWAKTYGGVNQDQAYSIQQTTDGGYIVAGNTYTFGAGDWDYWILKFDKFGTVAWQKTYGGIDLDIAFSIQQTTDGGYIVAGYTFSFGAGSYDMWVLKLDASGNVTWQKTYGGAVTNYGYSIQQTTDGGYILAGMDYDMLILKLDEGGAISWQKEYVGSNVDEAFSIQQTRDGGYIVSGYTETQPYNPEVGVIADMWILKLDQDGIVSWQKTFGGSGNDQAWSTKQTTDGGYIVLGYTESFGAGNRDIWILKLDADGNVGPGYPGTWQKTFGESGYDRAWSTKQTTDGGYIVAGVTSSFGAVNSDVWILKLDSSGEVTWEKTYGGSSPENAYSIQQTTDGGYIVAGYTASFGAGSSDVLIMKLDSKGIINNCDDNDTSAAIADTYISGVDTSVTAQTTFYTITDTAVIPQASTAVIEEHCFAPDWFPMEPPSQDKLNGVWGYLSSDPDHEFYAVGEEGRIHHFDGDNWSTSASYTSEDLYGIWGSSETDIFTVGDNTTIISYDKINGWESVTHSLPTTNLKDVWGSSATAVYTVGDSGFIAHYDGSTWTEVTITPPITETLTGIWGSSDADYVAVGEGGTIVTYDGSWTEVTPRPTTEDLSEVWGSASDNIYAIGKGGTILHYDGTSWSDLTTSPTSANLRGIWGSAEDNIFAVGENGAILYYDGSNWTKMDSGSQDSLISTFGTLNPRVMVVGHDGIILTLAGPSVQGRICNACTGDGIEDVTVEFDENKPAQHQSETTGPQGIYPAIEAQGGIHDILFTDTDYHTGSIRLDFPTGGYIFDHATYLVPVSGYDGCLSGTVTREVVIQGKPFDRGVQNMEVALYQGSTQIESTFTDIGGNYYFTGLDEEPYRVEPHITGSECIPAPLKYTIILPTAEQYNFKLTCPEPPPDTVAYWEEMESSTGRLLHGIWGSSGNNMFAVGDGGTIVHYDGTNWTSQTSTTESNLRGVWGSSGTEVYVVGAGGTVLKTTDTGSNWSPMTSDTPNGLNAIWGSSGGSAIFAVGDGGEIIHYNGTSWATQSSNTTVKLLGVWGNSGTDVYVVGNSHKDEYWKRTVIHYNGTNWSEVDTGNGVTLMSPWGSSATDITAAGSFGGIMRYDGTNWKQIGGPTEKTLNAMWGTSGTDIFAVGYNGVIAHYDGTGWTTREPGVPHDLYGIWGLSETEVYAVGDNGKIFAYTGDVDGDGEPDATDNCPNIQNQSQDDTDTDGYGDACDNCPSIPNGPLLGTCTYGTIGETCTSDAACDVEEGDGSCNKNQANSDYDAIGNTCDNCWGVSNPDQADSDQNCPDPPYSSDPACGNACDGSVEDADGDGVPDTFDNCPDTSNDDQYDFFPPGGNDCGDACECEGNFDGDQDCDGTDAATFKADFGRSQYKDPCTNSNVCQGDLECDVDVDGTDAARFKTDFGRSQYKDPCPDCPTDPWCEY